MNILLSSVGRRPYLVRWFKEALVLNGISGKVIAVDLDPHSPARVFADDFFLAPRVDDDTYVPWLRDLLLANNIELAVSINDFELSRWSALPASSEWASLIRLDLLNQSIVEDKVLMNKVLESSGILIPRTWTGERPNLIAEESSSYRFVTKGRFGSASRGLRFVGRADLSQAIDSASLEVTNRYGILAPLQDEYAPSELVIVQEEIWGTEFGLDVVCDLHRDFSCVFARRKIAMRNGETDRAESVRADEFVDVAKRIAKAVPHAGSIDVDVIRNENGDIYVIDINPRFGGGYPFSHLAGAHSPALYVAWKSSSTVKREWMTYQPGVIGGKYVEAVAVP